MKVNELYDKFWDFTDEGNAEKLLTWIAKQLKNKKDDLDLRYIYLECLRWNNMDVEDDQEEPIVQNYCTEIIRNKEKHSAITVAKAYSYRGEIKYRAIDRRKDFDKAKIILNSLNQKDVEVKFIKQFIDLQYPLEFRDYLFINTNYRNMFTF